VFATVLCKRLYHGVYCWRCTLIFRKTRNLQAASRFITYITAVEMFKCQKFRLSFLFSSQSRPSRTTLRGLVQQMAARREQGPDSLPRRRSAGRCRSGGGRRWRRSRSHAQEKVSAPVVHCDALHDPPDDPRATDAGFSRRAGRQEGRHLVRRYVALRIEGR
jgi:hypothetical protein